MRNKFYSYKKNNIIYTFRNECIIGKCTTMERQYNSHRHNYRDGMVRMIGATGAPFSEWTPLEFKMYQYNSTWRDDYIRISYEGIRLGEHIPAPSNTTTIGHGTFSFVTGSPYGGSLALKYNSQGVLSSDGKIITTDSVVAHNMRATYTIKAPYINATSGYFSYKVTGSEISVNGATTSNNYKLAVNSGILCEELKVMADVPSSDYVFEPTYNLKPLSEVEAYVTENKHLPDVPSAKEFKENGYKVGEMDNLLLQKIEELTLYIIDLQKQIEELKQEK